MGSAQAVGKREAAGPGSDDLGPAGYPEAIALLSETGLKATFFIEGWNALHNPQAVRRLVEAGHEVAMHGWVHEAIGSLEQVDVERVLLDAYAAFRRIGITPLGFRAPGGWRGPHVLPILRRLGLLYDSSVEHGFDDPQDALAPAPHILEGDFPNLPWQWSSIDYFHYAMHPAGPQSPAQMKENFLGKLRKLEEDGGFQTFIFHAFVSCETEERSQALREILEYAERSAAIDVVTANEAARILSGNGICA
ncbi:polysaccharide deacetylase family protein [Sphingobium sp. TB-6]|nr:polysaccharide deacetylase family protein [Sphingobium sp. TB-6]